VLQGSEIIDLSTFYVVVDYRTQQARRLSKSRAALFAISALGWPWKAAGLFGILPAAFLDRLYDLIAGNRYRVFGRHHHCLIPQPEYRSRFIDS
jgi:predicted DCC family thiol-disulfide oxidoreductase YuxK